MLTIKLSTNNPERPIIRQTPQSRGIWKNCRFYVDEPVQECDFWVVFDYFREQETVVCPPENTILITGEPTEIKQYLKSYTDQFGLIITCQRRIKHPNVRYSQQALPWHIGRKIKDGKEIGYDFKKDYDWLVKYPPINKDRLISVITSTKDFTYGHRQRLKFVQALSKTLGADLHVFGAGIQEIEDKWDAIAPYRYHVVIENSSEMDYWTEKLSDCYLGGAYPFYYGCPNVRDYFPTGSYTTIPLNVREAARIIRNGMNRSTFEASLSQMQYARTLVLDEYNIFSMLQKVCTNLPKDRVKRPTTLIPGETIFIPTIRNKIKARLISSGFIKQLGIHSGRG
jgi:hypothetical protein